MKPNPGPGKLIVLEGLDGAGTTTQSARLADWLRKYHKEEVNRVFVTREPSPGPAGAQIRSVLTRRIKMDGYTLAALFTADRIDHLYESNRGVVKRLQAGEWVIMDRYYLSSFAYQALSLKQDELRWLWFLHEPCLLPDITFFLNVPVETCMKRIAIDRGLHFELFETTEALDAVHLQYLYAMRRFRKVGHNIQMIEGTARVTSVAKIIRERVEMMFLDDTYLPAKEQQEVWQEWPGLKSIRRKVEEELNLSFVTIKKLPGAPGRPGGGSQGGYQLELASGERMYHVSGYFTNRKRSMHLVPLGPSDDILERLRELYPLRTSIPRATSQRRLFDEETKNERSDPIGF